MKTAKDIVKEMAEVYTEEQKQVTIFEGSRMDPVLSSHCEDMANNLNYMHRWLIKGQVLPVALRVRIAKWFREECGKGFEVIAVALEKNRSDLLV